jgi:hypothetical protein
MRAGAVNVRDHARERIANTGDLREPVLRYQRVKRNGQQR